jgi:hypothetical protein
MNKRMKELYKQAETECGWSEEKFAELIVRECAGIVKFTPTGVSHARIIEIIKEHFGVEEQVTEPSELHTCPYAEEIHGDYETLCDCDEEATRQCAMDI